ncbi:hypothetical protein [Nocardioides limicola]|uniref:hypothetical protein n=1 Tax=Nocardioides limicola TaxID=2803368 RepID=UPI00193BC4CC|nr:hypothetical protein [Nocardioides sp. DJM-14]
MVALNVRTLGASCWVRPQWGIGNEVVFGYLVAPSDLFERIRDRRRGDSVEFVAWDGIGDAAFGYYDRLPLRAAYHTAAGHAEGLARVGDQVVWVRLNRSNAGVEDVRPLLEKVVAQVSPAMVEHPVVLPSECPAVDHPLINRLLGEVEYARGDPGWTCSYVSSAGLGLQTEGWVLSPEALAKENEMRADNIAEGRSRDVEAEHGVSRTRSSGEDAWVEWVTVHDLSQELQVELVDLESRSKPVGVSEADFDELMDLMIEAWRDAVA